MKKLLSILCAFLMIFACIGCDKNDTLSIDDLNIQFTRSEYFRSATIKVRPSCDVEDLELIIEAYHTSDPFNPTKENTVFLETKLFDLGDLAYGEEYFITFELTENGFTEDYWISFFEYKIKSGEKA